jgi:regulator of replication initiation timing
MTPDRSYQPKSTEALIWFHTRELRIKNTRLVEENNRLKRENKKLKSMSSWGNKEARFQKPLPQRKGILFNLFLFL